jgi:hypothetical protein
MRRLPRETKMRSVFRAKSTRRVRAALPLVAAALLALMDGRTVGATASDPNDPNATSSGNSVDVGTFDVSGGTPRSWIQAALTRHQAFVAARVNAARNGQQPGVQGSNGATDTTTSNGSALDSLGSLSSLLSQAGSSSSTLDSLSSLLSNLPGTSSSTTTSATANKLSATQQSMSGATTTDSTSATDSSTDATAPFCERLASSLLDMLLSALVADFPSSSFVDFLKAQLEPLILPPASNQTNSASSSGG